MNHSRLSKAFLSFRLTSTFIVIYGMVPINTFTARTTRFITVGSLTTTSQLDAAVRSQQSKPQRKTNHFDAREIRSSNERHQQQRRRKRTRQPPELYEEIAMKYSKEEEDYDELLSFEVDSFQELQRSTGSEILDDQLQSQIDRASPAPSLFLDNHVSDASYLEKVAMSSVPEQLPQPAVNAFRQQQHQQMEKRKSNDLDFRQRRRSPR